MTDGFSLGKVSFNEGVIIVRGATVVISETVCSVDFSYNHGGIHAIRINHSGHFSSLLYSVVRREIKGKFVPILKTMAALEKM